MSACGPSRQMPMPCLCVRFQGIAEVGRPLARAGHGAIDPGHRPESHVAVAKPVSASVSVQASPFRCIALRELW
jgi:hypothetical protein